MKRKKIIQSLRVAGLLQGRRPAVINIFRNYGGYQNQGGHFILSIKDDDTLVFQNLTKFFHTYNETRNFSVKIQEITSFALTKSSRFLGCLSLYLVGRKFIPCYFSCETGDTYESEMNIKYITERLVATHKPNVTNVTPGEEEEDKTNED